MSKTELCLVLALALAAPSCSSRYGMPSATPPSTPFYDRGEPGGALVIDGLIEFGNAFPGRHVPKGPGQLAITGETIDWRNEDDEDRSFSIRAASVQSVAMECVSRAGGNVCLEIIIETVTGLTYHFRDIDWAAGYNQRIRQSHDHLERNFPSIVFSERTVDEIN